ncbi:shikimate dehydrogenase [Desulfococcus multivorans]|uniref:Shikimate dehydrogenase (NADP(+)) n=1 Tax=Desulfococcus multivorans DSM 2059 TaxID=1121405 RepID=S7TCS9_DESML|nr:shikimate dehydrogenase [Desulfococcus multivorans]AOY58753.1 AroE: shikimate dehydrogenase [Desulfococcus multivorans]AQV01037.1 shikimate dehydrogenase [Desulfococcus multivorans]EPR34335.1 Shikimate dehydrogenase [Desulfococcus multivorans DSM 2059]SJZ49457.1 shikimate dehydrogenase [Desulfococcus multivorans DSM 2059]
MDIDTNTRLYGIFGHPVAHSLSPAMHNRAFAAMGYNGVYLAFDVADIGAAVDGGRALGLGGWSITIPHKVAVMPLLDEVDPVARNIGAVNTVVNQGGRLMGYNSDGLGAVAALTEKCVVEGRSVAVIGAGGAARAIAFCLKAAGARITIVNRSIDRGEALARDLDVPFLPLAEFSKPVYHVLVNTTAVGMTPLTDAVPVDERMLVPEMTVMDIVYNPLKTRLLKTAARRGCTVVDGVAMFVYQGAFQFECWTGMKAPVALMRDTVMNLLGKRDD